MNQFIQWFGMGGYAMYVWPAYGLVCAVLLGNLISVKWHKKQLQQKETQFSHTGLININTKKVNLYPMDILQLISKMKN